MSNSEPKHSCQTDPGDGKPVPQEMGEEAPLGRIIGKWPGDETDEEIQAALADMDRNPLEATVAELRTQLAERDDRIANLNDQVSDLMVDVAERDRTIGRSKRYSPSVPGGREGRSDE